MINLELLLSVVNRVSFRFVLGSLVGVMMMLNFFFLFRLNYDSFVCKEMVILWVFA